MLEQHYLTTLFEPKSVAVIGASDRENSVGQIIFKNILSSGYKGRLYAINPKHETVQEQPSYKSIEEIGAGGLVGDRNQGELRLDKNILTRQPNTSNTAVARGTIRSGRRLLDVRRGRRVVAGANGVPAGGGDAVLDLARDDLEERAENEVHAVNGFLDRQH